MDDLRAVYLDTNAFLDLVEGDAAVSVPMQKLFGILRNRPGLGITSEITLAEILAPSSQGRARLPQVTRAYGDLLLWSGFLVLMPVSRSVLLETVKLRSTNVTGKLKLPDAIHLATAILSECRFFVSRDRRIPVPAGMRRVGTGALSVNELVETFAS